MPFGGICRLFTNIETYCKESLSGYPPYESSNLDAAANDPDSSPGFENMEMENFIYEKVSEDFDESQMGLRRIPFHGHAPRALSVLVEGTDISWRPGMEDSEAPAEVDYSAVSSSDMSGGIGSFSSMFMQTNWQVRGYLAEQANAIEKNGSAFPRRAFESILKKASEIGTRIASRSLFALFEYYHDGYLGALENLHRYFDYRHQYSDDASLTKFADQPVILHMLDIPPAAEALNGVKMELVDAAFPLLKGVVATTDVVEAWTGINIAVMVGGFPRKEGM